MVTLCFCFQVVTLCLFSGCHPLFVFRLSPFACFQVVTQGEGLPKYTDTAALALIVGHEVMQHIAQVLQKSEWKVIGHEKYCESRNGKLLGMKNIAKV